MELIVQPRDGIQALIDAVTGAKKSVDLIIFRFNLKPLEKVIEAAVGRGVAVRALIANTNSGGEKGLRELELRMLNCGVTVSRTGGDLVRYHGKMLIVDRKQLYVNGFNFTARDLASRSFGLITDDKKIVEEALRLFESDVQREDFEPDNHGFVVSPENAREQLATFIKHAKKQLVIWDPKVSDTQMLRLLLQRQKDGVDIRIIGKVGKRGSELRSQKMPGMRLHVRAMVRDGECAFVGSQSLRPLELDARREVGLITDKAKVVKGLLETFECDWVKTDLGKKELKAHEKELALAEVAAS